MRARLNAFLFWTVVLAGLAVWWATKVAAPAVRGALSGDVPRWLTHRAVSDSPVPEGPGYCTLRMASPTFFSKMNWLLRNISFAMFRGSPVSKS